MFTVGKINTKNMVMITVYGCAINNDGSEIKEDNFCFVPIFEV